MQADLIQCAHAALQYGIELQRSFNRDLVHHLRAAKDGGDPQALWLAVGLAFAYGVFHALGPGHGKFVVVTYFLAHQRRVARGFLMGTQIAVMHVVSAIVIVLIAHYLAIHIWGPTGDMPGLRTASYACIALAGAYMMWRALRPHEYGDCCGHADHNHGGDKGKQGLLSFTVGIAPCSGAVLLLIYCFANDIVPLGILMVSMIALGMALTMITLGLASILARHFVMKRLEVRKSGTTEKLTRIIEIGGASFIILFGLTMTITSALT
jgi:ABC-type nickel/cobalt efflux system permease component RcnA